MTLTREELKSLALPVLVALALVVVGALLIKLASDSRREANELLAAARSERNQGAERLARIAEEEREVKAKLDVYQQLKQLRVLGEERRLEWADAIARIRTQRELLDLRYRVDRQQLLTSVPGKPARVDFFASTMQLNMALLHEEDLLRFLADLRASGNAYYSVKKCLVTRTGQAATGATLTPRLRADCSIDLITILDRAAKS
jgi:type II secretory pathway component PulK